jgi:hypothetical protein
MAVQTTADPVILSGTFPFLRMIIRSRLSLMGTLTPELKQAVEQAGDSSVRLMDPETHQTYVLVSAEVYERLLLDVEGQREQAAFLRAAKKNARARLMEDA